MFFVAWFWVFFEMALFHEVRALEGWIAQFGDPAVNDAWADWPPPAGAYDAQPVGTFDPFHLPFLNTLILLTSGTTVTWAHHALQHNRRGEAKMGLFLTVLLGLSFTLFQVIEYALAKFTFGGNLYGASFFMATGFHGAHVIIGTIFLAVCLLRLMMGHFTPQKHFGFEAAAWYWHFVDVVWLFLFTFLYVVYG
ncbi:MAG: cytochrome c oxidase subunit 3, partial [Caulobacterales bacterium]|nr:cytochrome c oxidase subunit 3 [Caulobacterales bacterium]